MIIWVTFKLISNKRHVSPCQLTSVTLYISMELHFNGKRFDFKETVFNESDCDFKWQLSQTTVQMKGKALRPCKDESVTKCRQILNDAQLIALGRITISASLPSMRFLYIISCLGITFNWKKWFIFIFFFYKNIWKVESLLYTYITICHILKIIWVLFWDFNIITNFLFAFFPIRHLCISFVISLSNENC